MNPRDKIVGSLDQLDFFCEAIRSSANSEKIVLTSGCFDLLHGGHLQYICEAGKMGYLVVGINSDIFVKKLKGSTRPIRTQEDRAFLMAGFYHVRLVTIFNCDYELIRAVRPDIYVASLTSNVRIWSDKKRVGLLNTFGTEIIELGGFKRDSTTAIIKRAVIT